MKKVLKLGFLPKWLPKKNTIAIEPEKLEILVLAWPQARHDWLIEYRKEKLML